MNGVWDEGAGHRFSVWRSGCSPRAPSIRYARIYLFGWTTGQVHKLHYQWHLDWRSGGGTIQSVDLPELAARTHPTEEETRDACVAYIQGQILRGVFVVVDPTEEESKG